MINKPVVSIAIPTYQRPHYLREALQSVLTQTYSNLQVIVADNASGDETKQIVDSFADRRIIYLPSHQTLDVVLNFNRSLVRAEGKYFMFLCDDDLISPNYVEEMVRLMERQSLAMAYADSQEIDSTGKSISNKMMEKEERLEGIQFIKQWLACRAPIRAPISMFVYTEAVKKVGGLPLFPSGGHSDNALMVAMALMGDVSLCSRCVYYYRQHIDNAWRHIPWQEGVASVRAFGKFLYQKPIDIYWNNLSEKDKKYILKALEELFANQHLNLIFFRPTVKVKGFEKLRAIGAFPMSYRYIGIVCEFLGKRIKNIVKNMISKIRVFRWNNVMKFCRALISRRYERLIYSGRVLKSHLDALEVIASFFNTSPMPQINLIDVGCYKGYFLDRFQSLVQKPVFSVGIDPMRWEHVVPYSVFIEGAATNQSEGNYDFYEYNDPMCNSLKKMNVDKITHNPAEKSERFFVERHIETLTNIKSIEAAPLAAFIQRLKMEGEILHFLKIDAQGCDLEVFLSLREFIPRCLFVQMESLASKNKDIALYEDQSLFEEEKPVLEKYGFKLFSMTDYGQTGASPEADVIFLNLPLFNQLHASSLRRRFWARALAFVKC